MNDIEVPYIQFEDVINGYEDDQFFGPIVKALNDEWPDDQKQKLKLEKMLPMFEYKDKKVEVHYGKICVSRKFVSTFLGIAHDSKLGGHFKLTKMLSRLKNFHWRHKTRDVKEIRCWFSEMFSSSRTRIRTS